jgi:hypothetical protein
MRIALITPTYKREELFSKVIESVFAKKTYEFDYYVFFQEYSSIFISDIMSKYKINPIVSNLGKGYTKATIFLIDQVLNSGIYYDYLAYLDDDAVIVKNIKPEVLEMLNLDVGGVTCRLGFNAMNNRKYFHTFATYYFVKMDLIKQMRPHLLQDLPMRLENQISIETLLRGKKILIDKDTTVKHKVQNNSHLGDKEEYQRKNLISAQMIKEKYPFVKVTSKSLIYMPYFKKLYEKA